MSDGTSKSSTELLAERRGEKSVFEHMRSRVWPNRYRVTLRLHNIVGGVPTDKKVAEGWIRTKLAEDRDDIIRDMVAKSLVERGIAQLDENGQVDEGLIEQAIEEATELKHLNGFKRVADSGELYIEGRQVKAMIRESANIKWPKERWGPSRKGTRSYFAEHVFVEEDAIPLGVKEPSYVNQRFVHTWRGNGIQLEEIVEDAAIVFHLVTDHDFSQEEWGTLFLTAEYEGLGAARSQSFGRFDTVGFEKVGYDAS